MELYDRTGDQAYAAARAGYEHPQVNGWRLMQKPHVVQAVEARRRAREIMQDMLPDFAVELGARIFADGKKGIAKATNREFSQLGQLLLKYSGLSSDEDGQKGVDEMTADELAKAADAARARLAALEQTMSERAKPVIDIEADSSSIFD